ncbi:hypothetical protein V6N12_025041 [Hibiscus sabdariffa]|uniref:Uncharacterized protein n=1 Tax=Hibiscus sabdariffa TaxID=183260 RepID=A0ABR2BLW2_9ROSI
MGIYRDALEGNLVHLTIPQEENKRVKVRHLRPPPWLMKSQPTAVFPSFPRMVGNFHAHDGTKAPSTLEPLQSIVWFIHSFFINLKSFEEIFWENIQFEQ